jgi:hypothetical protein
MSQQQSAFAKLSEINILDKIERKGNISYLSWAWAWTILKQQYPEAQRRVYEDPATGWNYFTDGRYGWVKVGIEVDGIEHIDYLPIMDHRNNAIPLDRINQFEVNKTIQRSTAKAIAMHGLGLSLWTGEDIPELTTRSSAPSPSPAPTARFRQGGQAAQQDPTAGQAAQPNQAAPQEAPARQLIVLEKGSEAWGKVVAYIETNRSLGIEKIGKQLNRKYKISAKLKREIATLINPPQPEPPSEQPEPSSEQQDQSQPTQD